MSAVDPASLDAEIRERVDGQAAAAAARRDARRQQRADLAAARTAGLQQRHAAKHARNTDRALILELRHLDGPDLIQLHAALRHLATNRATRPRVAAVIQRAAQHTIDLINDTQSPRYPPTTTGSTR